MIGPIYAIYKEGDDESKVNACHETYRLGEKYGCRPDCTFEEYCGLIESHKDWCDRDAPRDKWVYMSRGVRMHGFEFETIVWIPPANERDWVKTRKDRIDNVRSVFMACERKISRNLSHAIATLLSGHLPVIKEYGHAYCKELLDGLLC